MTTHLGFDSSTADLSVYTFADATLGTAAEDRTIVVAGAVRGTVACTSLAVTVGGVTADLAAVTYYTGTGTCSFVALAHVPTGATGAIVVTASDTQLRCSVGWWAVNGRVSLVDRAADDAPDSDGLRLQNAKVTPVDGGVILAHAFAADDVDWSFGSSEATVDEDFDEHYDTFGTAAAGRSTVYADGGTDGRITVWAYSSVGFINRYMIAVSLRVDPWWAGLPWEQMVTHTGYLAAVTTSPRTVSGRLAVLDEGGTEIGDVPVTSLTVDYDGESAERWALDFTLADQSWVPRSDEDLLHPLSGHRVRAYWRIKAGQAWAEVPCGTYWTDDPGVDDNGTSITMDLSGHDAVAHYRRGGYGGRTIDVSGATVTDALTTVFEALGVTDYRISPTTATLPDPYALGTADDPWDDVADIAAMAGCDVWADRMGVIVVAPTPEPQSTRFEWQEGPTCPIVHMHRQLTTSAIRNRVVVTSTSPDVDPPVTGVDQDNDPSSPTWVGRPGFGVRETRIKSDKVTSVEAAQNMARATRMRWARAYEALDVDARQRPDLEFRDLMAASSSRSGVAGLWRVRGWTLHIPCGVQAPAQMRVRTQTRTML